MQAVKSSGSKIERMFQDALLKKGYSYETNYNQALGKPDIAFVELKVAVFCDSDFWHGYDWGTRKHDIKSDRDFWWKKIERNIERDKEVSRTLEEQGWTVLRFWGHDIFTDLDACVQAVESAIKTKTKRVEK